MRRAICTARRRTGAQTHRRTDLRPRTPYPANRKTPSTNQPVTAYSPLKQLTHESVLGYWFSSKNQGVKRRAFLSWVLLFLLLTAFDAWSTSGRPADPVKLIHSSWDSRSGLPQNSVTGIFQDSRGYLWLSTFDGLSRFDGVRFVRTPDDQVPGRRLNIVGSDADGFWIAGEHDGLVFHDGNETTPFPLEELGIGGTVGSVQRDMHGLWIGTSHGLHLIDDERRVRHFDSAHGLPDDSAGSVLSIDDGRLYVGTSSGLAVGRIDRLDEGFQAMDRPGLIDGAIYRLLDDQAGGLYVASDYGLLHVAADDSRRFLPIPEGEPQIRSVRNLIRDRHGALWATVSGDAIYRIQGDDIRRFGREEGVVDRRFSALYEDHEGHIWYGTDGGGMGQLRPGKAKAYRLSDWGVDSTAVTTLVEHPEGGLWLGLNCGGVAHFRDGIRKILDEPEGLTNGCVFSLLVDDDNRLWAGSYGGAGMHRLNGGEFAPIDVPVRHRVVMAIFQHSDGSIWAGTTAGLLRHDPVSDSFSAVDEAGTEPVSYISEGPDGRLWLARSNGVDHGDPTSGMVRLEDDRLDQVRAIHHGGDGVTWIGTYGNGLFRHDGERLFQFTPEHGLKDEVVSFIIDDGQGHFWLSGNRGIHGLAIDELEAVADGKMDSVDALAIGADDGMLTVETTGGSQPAGLQTSGGILWFPTIDGMARLHPESIARNPLPPPVVIETVVIDGQPHAAGDLVDIPAGTSNIEIHYTGLSFSVPEQVSFRYRLGETSEWVEADTRRVAYFSNLPPGQHEFEVTAANSDGVWNPQGASLQLHAQARFTQTAWFPVLIALLASALIAALFSLRLQRMRLHEKRLAGLVRERTQALESANRKLSELARVDELTGMANRRHLEEALKREWARAGRRNESLGLVLIDIDYFKEYNDLHGHLAGDTCLRRIAEALDQCLQRTGDLLARYGGEEFLAVLPDTDEEGARAIAETMRQRVADLAIEHGASDASKVVTISAGIAATIPRPEAGKSSNLLRAADQALYLAKEGGRNRVQMAGRDSAISG